MRVNTRVISDIRSGKILERIAHDYSGPVARLMGAARGIAAYSTTVLASPALAAETVICTLPGFNPPTDTDSVIIIGWCAITMGTSGTSCRLRIEQGAAAGGTVVGDSGLVTGVAAAKYAPSVMGIDTPGAVDQFQYSLTATIASGSAASTVASVALLAFLL